MNMQSRLQSYIGIPYCVRGEEGPGMDCWQLTQLVMSEVFGVKVPGYDEVYEDQYARNDATLRAALDSGLWETVDVAGGFGTERPGDVIILRFMGVYTHAGVIVDSGRRMFLHVPMNGSSCIERYDSTRWISKLVGVFRWKGGRDAN